MHQTRNLMIIELESNRAKLEMSDLATSRTAGHPGQGLSSDRRLAGPITCVVWDSTCSDGTCTTQQAQLTVNDPSSTSFSILPHDRVTAHPARRPVQSSRLPDPRAAAASR
jgi:hypothetical protein